RNRGRPRFLSNDESCTRGKHPSQKAAKRVSVLIVTSDDRERTLNRTNIFRGRLLVVGQDHPPKRTGLRMSSRKIDRRAHPVFLRNVVVVEKSDERTRGLLKGAHDCMRLPLSRLVHVAEHRSIHPLLLIASNNVG